jgi:deoxyribodipyrimidine photolyase-like uncharacterized protein
MRRLIGWRNYVYVLYELEGDNMKKTNLLKANNKIIGTKNYIKFGKVKQEYYQ